MNEGRLWTRRAVLRAGAVTAGLGAAAALAGCGSGGAAAGRVRVGAAGDSGATVVDPRTAATPADFIALLHVYDGLVRLHGKGYEFQLATAVEPNADATAFTVRIRDGVEFHDGRRLTARDAAYSLRVLADRRQSPGYSLNYADVDGANIRAVDPTTLRIPLRRPRADFVESTLAAASHVLPEDSTGGIGTGPFRVESINQGVSIDLAAFDRYWAGRPAVDGLQIVRIADPAARLNGLLGAQLDFAAAISPTALRAQQGNPAVVVRATENTTANAVTLSMNQQLPPFNDPRVRQAVCAVVDRRQLVDSVLAGVGTTGNDVIGIGFEGYATDLPTRERDVDTARALFAAAGVRTLPLLVSEVVPGMVESAGTLTQQFAAAGVTLQVNRLSPGDVTTQRRAPFQTFFYINRPPAVHLSLLTGPSATFNVAGYGPDWFAELVAAQTERDDTRRRARFVELQHEVHDRCAEAVWGYQRLAYASVPTLSGVDFVQSTPIFHRARAA